MDRPRTFGLHASITTTAVIWEDTLAPFNGPS